MSKAENKRLMSRGGEESVGSGEDGNFMVNKKHGSGYCKKTPKSAMTEVARKANRRYMELRTMEKGDKRAFHDDITVIVVFIDHELLD
ncbi:hypothetical protein L6452_38855 [Arctium lappa]|uniref:Uncharacterized protein n=1 Tax=Arctium lappa TaxID=4217 RepID=A0ACB8XQN9_ARCLA|nr:hypothetical protein L6452_38855 [Arctium lappa]